MILMTIKQDSILILIAGNPACINLGLDDVITRTDEAPTPNIRSAIIRKVFIQGKNTGFFVKTTKKYIHLAVILQITPYY